MALAEFLHDRIADEEAAELARQLERFTDGVPAHRLAEAGRIHRRTTQVHLLRLATTMRQFGWALATTPPLSWMGWARVARAKARQYSDHPDFDQAWLA